MSTAPSLRPCISSAAFALLAPVFLGTFSAASGQFAPNNLVLGRSVYDNDPHTVAVGEVLSPGCALSTTGCPTGLGAVADGTYPFVFNNRRYDRHFGVAAPIYLDQMSTSGQLLSTAAVPSSPAGDHMVTSFNAGSELGFNLSTDNLQLTFMGFEAPKNSLDVADSNTPAVADQDNPDHQALHRAVAQVGPDGKFHFTRTDAYSGGDGRAAILNTLSGAYYTAGSATHSTGNTGALLGGGAQIVTQRKGLQADQDPGMPTPFASFSVATLGGQADGPAIDDDFRGMALYNNVLYLTKGSGSGGVNTVYFVDTSGTACPNGVGLPIANPPLPSATLPYNTNTFASTGLPSNLCILAGFPSSPGLSDAEASHPFGLYFANATTLYVADEGDTYVGGTDLYAHAAAQSRAGVQKWMFNSTTQRWEMAYVLQSGLGLGQPYSVANYPTGTNAATGLPWSPATDGVRQVAGAVDASGVVTLYVTTSTVSGNGDPGADPNQLFVGTDTLANTQPPAQVTTGGQGNDDRDHDRDHHGDAGPGHDGDRDCDHKGDHDADHKGDHDSDHKGDHDADHKGDHDADHKGDHDCDHKGDHDADHKGDHDCDHKGDHDADHKGDHDCDHKRDHDSEHKGDHDCDHKGDHDSGDDDSKHTGTVTFKLMRQANAAEVFRGISWTPGTNALAGQ